MQDRLDAYFNTSAFVRAGELMGNTGRNVLRGPGQRNLDFSVIKHFAITEKRNIEWRSEFFNVFNVTNFVNPGNNVSTASTSPTPFS